MSIYYVDLGLNTTGHLGTINDPFSYLDYVSASINDGDEVYKKGIIDLGSGSNYDINKGVHKGWDIKNNGPWRIRAEIFSNDCKNGDYIRDCIISADMIYLDVGHYTPPDQSTDTFIIRNAIIYTPCLSLYQYAFGNIIFEGCTLIIDVIAQNDEPDAGNIIFKDCIIIKRGTSSELFSFYGEYCSQILFKNVVCTENIENTGDVLEFTLDSCQENWTPAKEWPDWDGSKEEFMDPSLYEGITSPPQPGNPPYSGYETDLFGNNRTGIGSGCFSSEEEEEEEQQQIVSKRIDPIKWIYNKIHTIGEVFYKDKEDTKLV